MLTCDHAERNQNHASRELSKIVAVRLGLLQSNGVLAGTVDTPLGCRWRASREERTLAPGGSNAALFLKYYRDGREMRKSNRLNGKCNVLFLSL